MADDTVRSADTAPDSTDLSGPCPRCGRIANFMLLGSIPVTYRTGTYAVAPDGRRERLVDEQVSVLQCAGCQQNTVVVEEVTLDGVPYRLGGRSGRHGWSGIHWWPSIAVAADEAIPEAIRSAFAEGVACLSANAPRAAAVMFRRTLEGIVVERGSEAARAALARNLSAALDQMAADHALTNDLAEWAREIRLVGNAGGHYDVAAPVMQQEAQDLARLMRALLEYLYELPARLRRSRQQPTGGQLGPGS